MNKIKRNEATEEEWKSYIEHENKAYDELIKKGYTPQGIDKHFKNVDIVKIENENTNNERRSWFSFENWQTANKNLI